MTYIYFIRALQNNLRLHKNIITQLFDYLKLVSKFRKSSLKKMNNMHVHLGPLNTPGEKPNILTWLNLIFILFYITLIASFYHSAHRCYYKTCGWSTVMLLYRNQSQDSGFLWENKNFENFLWSWRLKFGKKSFAVLIDVHAKFKALARKNVTPYVF